MIRQFLVTVGYDATWLLITRSEDATFTVRVAIVRIRLRIASCCDLSEWIGVDADNCRRTHGSSVPLSVSRLRTSERGGSRDQREVRALSV